MQLCLQEWIWWHSNTTKNMNSLSSGTVSDVLGILSSTTKRNTEKDNRTVMPNETFSPDSGGSQNTRRSIRDSKTIGAMTLMTLYWAFLCSFRENWNINTNVYKHWNSIKHCNRPHQTDLFSNCRKGCFLKCMGFVSSKTGILNLDTSPWHIPVVVPVQSRWCPYKQMSQQQPTLHSLCRICPDEPWIQSHPWFVHRHHTPSSALLLGIPATIQQGLFQNLPVFLCKCGDDQFQISQKQIILNSTNLGVKGEIGDI